MKESIFVLVAFALGAAIVFITLRFAPITISVQPSEVIVQDAMKPVIIYRTGVPNCGLAYENEPCTN